MVNTAAHFTHHHDTLVDLGNRLGDAEGDLDRFADDGDPADRSVLISDLHHVADVLDDLIGDLEDLAGEQVGHLTAPAADARGRS